MTIFASKGFYLVSSSQIKAARYLLGWTAADLAEACGVSNVTIKRYEAANGVPDGRVAQLMPIKTALEVARIEFLGDPILNPGVQLKPQD